MFRPARQAFLDDLENLCDPEIEECATVEEMHCFEEMEQLTLYYGMIGAVFAIAPLFITIYPFWLTKTDAQKELLKGTHKAYLFIWAWMGITHALLFGPWIWSWTVLFFGYNQRVETLDDPKYIFYEYWLTNFIVPSVLWLVGITEVMWLYIIAAGVS